MIDLNGSSSYLLLFSRAAVGTLFLASLASKLRSPGRFRDDLLGFGLVPERWAPAAVALLLGSEATVAGLIVAGGSLAAAGFAAAIGLLVLFSAVLASALRRGLDVPCGCFGGSERRISRADLVRNGGFIACAAAGLGAALAPAGTAVPVAEAVLLALAAVAFTLVWSQLGNLLDLFENT